MTWIKRAELLMTWKTLTWLMTWQVTRLMAVQNCCCGCWLADDVAGQPGSVVGCRAKKEHVGACCASVSVGSPDIDACGHSGGWFFAGVSPVGCSRFPLHDGMYKNTF